MWIANDGQRAFMNGKASYLFSKLKEWEKHDKDTLVNFIFTDFCEMIRMGYSIAMDEAHSTPWEWMMQPITNDASDNEAIMDDVSREGWEFHATESGWIIWRRRKAVSDGKTDNAN